MREMSGSIIKWVYNQGLNASTPRLRIDTVSLNRKTGIDDRFA